MSRPEYLHCIMTPGVIRGIRERQAAYDRDPEAYEQEEMRQEEDHQREQQKLADAFRQEEELKYG